MFEGEGAIAKPTTRTRGLSSSEGKVINASDGVSHTEEVAPQQPNETRNAETRNCGTKPSEPIASPLHAKAKPIKLSSIQCKARPPK